MHRGTLNSAELERFSREPIPELAEQRLCRIVGDYLRSHGWKVVGEVPLRERTIDLGAIKEGLVTLIEAKTSFTLRLQYQVQGLSFACHRAIAVIGTAPRPDKFAWAQKMGIGLWRVLPSGGVIELLDPSPHRPPSSECVNRLIERIERLPESVGGGLPCLKGRGAAIDAEAATAAYRIEHPGATWAEIWTHVPNHYASPASMRSASFSNRNRRAVLAELEASKPKAS